MSTCSGDGCNCGSRSWNINNLGSDFYGYLCGDPIDLSEVSGKLGDENRFQGFQFIKYRISKGIWFLKQVYNLVINGQWESNRPYVTEIWTDESGKWKKIETHLDYPVDREQVISRIENGMSFLTSDQWDETIDYIKRNLK